MALSTAHPTNTARTRAWRPCDEVVELVFELRGGPPTPSSLSWRGSLWSVVGSSRHWSTWHALPIRASVKDAGPTNRALSVDFWRFAARTSPISPLMHFEVRRSSNQWRLVRLGASIEIPEPTLPPHIASSR